MNHYVYMISYSDIPNVYYGSRTCKCSPEEDIYWGSPKTYRAFMDVHASTRIKTILFTDFQTREEANVFENSLIQQQWDEDKSLSLNDHIGNEKFCQLGRKHDPKTTQKMSDSHKGEKNHFYGRSHTPESIQQISENRKGTPAWNKGIPNSPEARKKISAAHKGRTPEHRVKSFVGISPNGDVVFFRNSLKFCRDNPDLELDQRSISACANGVRKTAKGWRFLFKEDYEALNGEIPELIRENVKSFVGISPAGDRVYFTNAKKFVEDHPDLRLNASLISQCALGNKEHHRGWLFFHQEYYETLNDAEIEKLKPKFRSYLAISPEGDTYTFDNVAQFCRDNPQYKFSQGSIGKCLKGESKQHKNWRFLCLDESDIA
jgi:hypothetical protein